MLTRNSTPCSCCRQTVRDYEFQKSNSNTAPSGGVLDDEIELEDLVWSFNDWRDETGGFTLVGELVLYTGAYSTAEFLRGRIFYVGEYSTAELGVSRWAHRRVGAQTSRAGSNTKSIGAANKGVGTTAVS